MASHRVSWFQRLLVALGMVLPAPVEAMEELRPGRVQLVGSLQSATPLRAPVSGRECVAYFYSASAVGSGRASLGARMRTLRRASVYAPAMTLELRGGEVGLQPPPSDDLDAQAHAALAAQDWPGFKAKERLLRPGARVQVLGKAVAGADRSITVVVQAIAALPDSEPRDRSRPPSRA